MTLRSFIGLCEHRWQDQEQITAWNRRRHVFTPGEMKVEPEICVGIRVVQRCTVCGKVRSVRL